MKKLTILYVTLFLAILSSCSNDDSDDLIDFSVTFNTATINTTETETTTEISLNFSRAATEAGTITVSYSGETPPMVRISPRHLQVTREALVFQCPLAI